MSAVEQVITRTEREVAADTIVALMLAGIIGKRHQSEATAAAGLTFPDVEAAHERHRRHGFVAPAEVATEVAITPVAPRAKWKHSKTTTRHIAAHPEPGKKKCSRCQGVFPETEFHWKEKSKGRRMSYCRTCARAKANARYLSVGKIEALNEVGLTFIVDDSDDVVGLKCMTCSQPITVGQEVHGTAALAHSDCEAR